MTLPEIDVARIQRWCRARASQVVRDQVWVEADVAEQHATIVQCRLPWGCDVGLGWTRSPIARLHDTKASKRWSLYWRDRNLRFHACTLAPPTDTVEELLAEVERDPTTIFWG